MEGNSTTLADRQSGLAGSWLWYQGPSRCGKTYEAVRVAILSAMAVGGECLMYDPAGDVASYVAGYRRFQELRCDSTSGDDRKKACRKLDFLRDNVTVYSGRNAVDIFDAVSEVIGDGIGHSEAFGSVFIDEGAVARTNPQFLELIAPLFGNAGILGVATGQRLMSIPPQVRGIIRFRCLWLSSDYTGDDLPKIEGFKFSPVMSDETLTDAEREYRGVYSGVQGSEFRSYNPSVARRPDWLLLPAPISRPAIKDLK